MRGAAEAVHGSASGMVALRCALWLVAAFVWLSLVWNLPVAADELGAAGLLGVACWRC